MDHFLGTSKRSAHEVGLLDLLDIARLTGHFPRHRALVGIQYARFAWGEALTPEVNDSIPLAGRLAANVLQKWRVEQNATRSAL